jgi:metal-responsive CopG/Arc/MetJ family transcriptional regulator
MKLIELWLPAELLDAIYMIVFRDRYRSRNAFIISLLRQFILKWNCSGESHTGVKEVFTTPLRCTHLPVPNMFLDAIDAIVIEGEYPDRSALFADILSQSIKDLGYSRE